MVVTECCNSGNCTRQSPTRLLYALLRSLIEFSGEAQHTKQSSIKENNQKGAFGFDSQKPPFDPLAVKAMKLTQLKSTQLLVCAVEKKLIDPVKTSQLMPEGKLEVIVWQEEDPWGPYIINAIKAKELYEINKDYIVTVSDEVHIIDRSTGRIRPRTRWQDNIHQVRPNE